MGLIEKKIANFKDLTGMKFGRLAVIKIAESTGNGARWHCVCDCGNETIS